MTDMSEAAEEHPSVALFGEGYGLDRAAMDMFTDAYLATPADGSQPYASPLVASDLTGVAPAHVLVAEYDVLRDSGEAYAKRLEAAGVETTLHRFSGHTHGSSALWRRGNRLAPGWTRSSPACAAPFAIRSRNSGHEA